MNRTPVLPKELQACIRPLSGWQRTDCFACRREAKSEAHLSWSHHNADIRCCGEGECQEAALQMAERSVLAAIIQAGKTSPK